MKRIYNLLTIPKKNQKVQQNVVAFGEILFRMALLFK